MLLRFQKTLASNELGLSTWTIVIKIHFPNSSSSSCLVLGKLNLGSCTHLASIQLLSSIPHAFLFILFIWEKGLDKLPRSFWVYPAVPSHCLSLLSSQHWGLVELGWTHSPNLHDTVPYSCQDLSNRNVEKCCPGVHMLCHHTDVNFKQLWNLLSWSFAVFPSYWFLATGAMVTDTAQWGYHLPRAKSATLTGWKPSYRHTRIQTEV